jgi:hypothetical protein
MEIVLVCAVALYAVVTLMVLGLCGMAAAGDRALAAATTGSLEARRR